MIAETKRVICISLKSESVLCGMLRRVTPDESTVEFEENFRVKQSALSADHDNITRKSNTVM